MTRHLPECNYARNPERNACICERLRECEKRVTVHERSWENAVTIARAGYQDGYDAALKAVGEAVDAIPAPYKVKGEFATYGAYNEGRADMKDQALAAVDALKEKQ